MYFTECARLAERHPELSGVIQQVDSQLREMGSAEVIRIGDFASFMGVDPNQVTAVLQMLAQDGVLLCEEMIECPHCGMAVLRSEYEYALDEEGEYRCTDCDRPLSLATAQIITTYRQGEQWKETLRLKKETDAAEIDKSSAAQTTPDIMLDEQAWYTHDRLSEIFGVPKESLRKRLDRYRKSNLDGWKENEDRRPREPKYLFQLKGVKRIIEELRAST